MKSKAIKKKLKKIIENEPASIKAFVAQEALNSGYSLKSYFRNVTQHGCVSGMVSSLIYYHQTHQFFETYYDQIEELRMEFEEATGTKLDLGNDLKNTLAWFAFEETAHQLVSEFELV